MTDDLRCSAWTRSQRVDPIGTAGGYSGFLLVEWPLPWPRDVSEIPELADVAAVAKRQNTRLQALVPRVRFTAGDQISEDGGTEAKHARVALYRWDAARGRFSGVEVRRGLHESSRRGGQRDEMARAALGLLKGEEAPGCRPIEFSEVLICGHGRRDRCCGSMGTALEKELLDGDPLGPGVEVWRTSHTGGHRFAPTAIVLPEGSFWGYLDQTSIRRIVARSGPPDDQLDRYRGCTGLGSPNVQALEREVFAAVGWELFDWPRAGQELGDGLVELRAKVPGRGFRFWRGRVDTRRTVPIPPCGRPIGESDKSESELAVHEFEETTAGPRTR